MTETEELLEQRAEWLRSLGMSERNVLCDEEGREYFLRIAQDDETLDFSTVKVYLPITIQNIIMAREKTGYVDEKGEEICFGDKIKHAVGHEYVVNSKNLGIIKRISEAAGYEDLGGWIIIEKYNG